MTSVIVLALAAHFIHVTAPDGQQVDIAVDQISIVRHTDDSHHPEAKCLIGTNDGKSQAVMETCLEVEAKINEAYHKREQELEREQQER